MRSFVTFNLKNGALTISSNGLKILGDFGLNSTIVSSLKKIVANKEEDGHY